MKFINKLSEEDIQKILDKGEKPYLKAIELNKFLSTTKLIGKDESEWCILKSNIEYIVELALKYEHF